MNPHHEIRALLQSFQDGYTRRDLTHIDAFMKLFTADAEVIGTNGVQPGVEEWYVARDSVQQLVEGDWRNWGDLCLDLESVSIHSCGIVGWVAASANVTQTIGSENYAAYLDLVRTLLDESELGAEEKLLYILRGGMSTLYELRRGDKFVWPLRFTAVVLCEADGWKFAQMTFSFPTIYFPDVRRMDYTNDDKR